MKELENKVQEIWSVEQKNKDMESTPPPPQKKIVRKIKVPSRKSEIQ